jgi:hypothetical protein
MRRFLLVGLIMAVALGVFEAAPVAGQTTVERILVRVDNDIVTALDVRQARLLKLVHVDADTEAAVADALVDRRLELAAVARYSPPEPTPDALAARRREWEASLGAGVNVADLLSRAGMNEAGLTGWLRDDLRIQAYLDRRFAAFQVPLRDDVQKYYQEHEADYTVAGVLRPLEDVEPDVRAKLSARIRAANVASFIADLRKQADIR